MTASAWRRITRRYSAAARQFELDYRIQTVDGGARMLRVLGHEDPARPGWYTGTVQDVTAARRAEAELRSSENRLRAISQSTPIGIALLEARTPWRLINANPAMGEMLGVETELDGSEALSLFTDADCAAAQSMLQDIVRCE